MGLGASCSMLWKHSINCCDRLTFKWLQMFTAPCIHTHGDVSLWFLQWRWGLFPLPLNWSLMLWCFCWWNSGQVTCIAMRLNLKRTWTATHSLRPVNELGLAWVLTGTVTPVVVKKADNYHTNGEVVLDSPQPTPKYMRDTSCDQQNWPQPSAW